MLTANSGDVDAMLATDFVMLRFLVQRDEVAISLLFTFTNVCSFNLSRCACVAALL